MRGVTRQKKKDILSEILEEIRSLTRQNKKRALNEVIVISDGEDEVATSSTAEKSKKSPPSPLRRKLRISNAVSPRHEVPSRLADTDQEDGLEVCENGNLLVAHDRLNSEAIVHAEVKPVIPSRAARRGDCAVCCEFKKLYEETLTARCKHTANICYSCISRHIQMEVKKKKETVISCIEAGSGCEERLKYKEMEAICRILSRRRELTEWDSSTFTLYDKALLSEWHRQEEESCACTAPDCTNIQVTVRGDQFMKCRECGWSTCIRHKVKMHVGLTCEEYERTKLPVSFDDKMKACPQCKMGIEKIAGCDQMICKKNASGCGAEFCWVCFALYTGENGIRLVGNSAHKETCVHFRPQPKSTRLTLVGDDESHDSQGVFVRGASPHLNRVIHVEDEASRVDSDAKKERQRFKRRVYDRSCRVRQIQHELEPQLPYPPGTLEQMDRPELERRLDQAQARVADTEAELEQVINQPGNLRQNSLTEAVQEQVNTRHERDMLQELLSQED